MLSQVVSFYLIRMVLFGEITTSIRTQILIALIIGKDNDKVGA
jgi:hypothetical protein